MMYQPAGFLSTLSLRRATQTKTLKVSALCISIHALLAESDPTAGVLILYPLDFYPRSPCGERQWPLHQKQRVSGISIHALLAESDRKRSCPVRPPGYFYPRSPCGERRPRSINCMTHMQFLSTLSLRRATAKVHKTVGHFCAYGTNFMGIASSC